MKSAGNINAIEDTSTSSLAAGLVIEDLENLYREISHTKTVPSNGVNFKKLQQWLEDLFNYLNESKTLTAQDWTVLKRNIISQLKNLNKELTQLQTQSSGLNSIPNLISDLENNDAINIKNLIKDDTDFFNTIDRIKQEAVYRTTSPEDKLAVSILNNLNRYDNSQITSLTLTPQDLGLIINGDFLLNNNNLVPAFNSYQQVLSNLEARAQTKNDNVLLYVYNHAFLNLINKSSQYSTNDSNHILCLLYSFNILSRMPSSHRLQDKDIEKLTDKLMNSLDLFLESTEKPVDACLKLIVFIQQMQASQVIYSVDTYTTIFRKMQLGLINKLLALGDEQLNNRDNIQAFYSFDQAFSYIEKETDIQNLALRDTLVTKMKNCIQEDFKPEATLLELGEIYLKTDYFFSVLKDKEKYLSILTEAEYNLLREKIFYVIAQMGRSLERTVANDDWLANFKQNLTILNKAQQLEENEKNNILVEHCQENFDAHLKKLTDYHLALNEAPALISLISDLIIYIHNDQSNYATDYLFGLLRNELIRVLDDVMETSYEKDEYNLTIGYASIMQKIIDTMDLDSFDEKNDGIVGKMIEYVDMIKTSHFGLFRNLDESMHLIFTNESFGKFKTAFNLLTVDYKHVEEKEMKEVKTESPLINFSLLQNITVSNQESRKRTRTEEKSQNQNSNVNDEQENHKKPKQ